MFQRASILLPIALIVAMVAGFLITQPLDDLTRDTPPVENLNIESVALNDTGIEVVVRASGSQPVTVAQVQVDGAYWQFTQTPNTPIGYLQSAVITIPYPWVSGEAHTLLFITDSGLTFTHTIEVAIPTPGTDISSLLGLALVGFFVGVVPILIGYGFYPALMSFGDKGRQF
ncbi:MAG: metal transporter, partial [Hyphomicrobiales bacterium]